jgi:hypothetical protein
MHGREGRTAIPKYINPVAAMSPYPLFLSRESLGSETKLIAEEMRKGCA